MELDFCRPEAAVETSEALPVAEKASLFRGCGAIGGHEVPGNRNAATVYGCEVPCRREGCFWAQEMSRWGKVSMERWEKCSSGARCIRRCLDAPACRRGGRSRRFRRGRMRPTFSFVLAKDKVNCPEGKRVAPGGKRAAPGTKENRLFIGLLVRPVKTGLVSSSCAEPVELSLRSRRICFIGCKPEGAKRTRGPSCAAAARPGNRRRLLPAGAYTFFFCPLSGSGTVAESSPICTNNPA